MVALFLLLLSALAGEIKLVVDHDQIRVGQSVQVEVELQDIDSVSSAPIVPSGSGISIQLQSNRATKIFRSVNFQSTTIIKYHYLLHAHEEGEWTIGPVEVKAGNRLYRSNQLTISVLSKQANTIEDINVSASLSSAKPFEGEVVLYKFKYRYRVQTVGLNWSQPEFEGFRLFDGLDIEQKDYNVLEQGRRVGAVDLFVPLVATKSGKYIVSPSSLTVQTQKQVSRQRRSAFGPMIRDTQTKIYATDPIRGEVRPLPPSPKTFSGLVGEFSLASKVDKTVVAVGDSIDVALQLSGYGIVDGFSFPNFSQQDIQVYDEDPTYETKYKQGKVWSKAHLVRAIVPTKKGKLRIPPFKVLVFDPKQEKYVTLQTDPIDIEVQQGASQDLDLASFVSPKKAEDAPLPEGIRPVASGAQIGTMASNPVWLWFAPLGLLFGIALRRFKLPKRKSPKLKYPQSLPKNKEQRLEILHRFFLQVVGRRCNKPIGELVTADFVRLGLPAQTIQQRLHRIRYGSMDEDMEELELQIQAFWRGK